jgi:endonuclease/exonuclease/phosphatase family metal-dependent hydrolase
VLTRKGATGARLAVTPPVAVVNTHMNAWSGARNDKIRERQLEHMRTRIDSLKEQETGWEGILIGGDFNIQCGGEAHERMLRILKPTDQVVDCNYTWPSQGSSDPAQNVRLDYIFQDRLTQWATVRHNPPVLIGGTLHQEYAGVSDHLGTELELLTV